MHLPEALTPDSVLESRQLGGGGYRYRTRRRTPWSNWGRWVLAGILIFVGLILMFMFLCLSRRRRRNRQLAAGSQAPMTSHPHHSQGPPMGGDYNQAGYGNGNQGNYGGAPPGYSGNGGAGDYYGPQHGGVTQPGNAYVK